MAWSPFSAHWREARKTQGDRACNANGMTPGVLMALGYYPAQEPDLFNLAPAGGSPVDVHIQCETWNLWLKEAGVEELT